MKVTVLRIGHRFVRDDRVTTHAALVSRAFGSNKIYMTDVDESIKQTLRDVSDRWGGAEDFEIEITDDWKRVLRNWKEDGKKVAHLTMYGLNIDDVIEDICKCDQIMVIIGAEKVPREIYEMADFNVAIGNQPHSEIAALAIFLDRVFKGGELKREFADGRLKIIPTAKGKSVQEKSDQADNNNNNNYNNSDQNLTLI